MDSIATGVSSSPIDMDTLEQKCIKLKTLAESHEAEILRTVASSEDLLSQCRAICNEIGNIMSSVKDTLGKETKEALVNIFKGKPLCNRLLLGNNPVVVESREMLKRNGYLVDDVEINSIMVWSSFSWKRRTESLGLLALYAHVVRELQGPWVDDGLQWLKRAYLEMKCLDDLPSVSHIKSEIDKYSSPLVSLGTANEQSDDLVGNLELTFGRHQGAIAADATAGCGALIAEFTSYVDKLKAMNEETTQYWILFHLLPHFSVLLQGGAILSRMKFFR